MEWYFILTICVGALLIWILLSAILYKCFFKRFYDIFFSSMLIIILSPLLLLLMIVGAIKMKGNPFFTQLRPGKNERIFKLIKFRTMTCEKDENGNLLPDEKRLTKYGKFLRATSLDELPELFNIFIGKMSFIGPRPLLVEDMLFMTTEERKRHSVKGGLTGLAQVNGRNSIPWEQKLSYDLQYVDKISFFGDIKIFLLTIREVFKTDDIAREGTVSDLNYGDYLLLNGKITKDEYDKKKARSKVILHG